MSTYKTPGVYVEEVSTLPPSVAQVATAIPAFIGYTESGAAFSPTRITSMLEYEQAFGGPAAESIQLSIDVDTNIITEQEPSTSPSPNPSDYLLYYSVKLYFANGGGGCYIVSVGNYTEEKELKVFTEGLDAIAEVDEPTLLLLPDATTLANKAADDPAKDSAEYYALCQTALTQCLDLQDRFTIIDVVDKIQLDEKRNPVPTPAEWLRSKLSPGDPKALSYGAAYTPYVNTYMTRNFPEENVRVQLLEGEQVQASPDHVLIVTYSKPEGDKRTPKVKLEKGDGSEEVIFELKPSNTTITLHIKNIGDERSRDDIIAAWGKMLEDKAGFDLKNGTKSGNVKWKANAIELTASSKNSVLLTSIKTSNNVQYNEIKKYLTNKHITLPPSGAIAGIYASVDHNRGVWKAPANVGVMGISALTQTITHEEQEGLNVDANSGKSINAIRVFTGKGPLVWGARTLAGNDNEWRYVSVRRLFITIEESVQKASAFAVFEPNDATTWLKVKAMIDNYLYGLWQQGALAGAKPEDSYFVNVGLGKTMTSQDILEGRMIVEIGIAAVRPAEFIILKFSHLVQQS